MRFSQRIGKRPVSAVLQTDGMDDDLRNSLWNVLDEELWSRSGFLHSQYGSGAGHIHAFSKLLWFHFFKKPMDTRPEYPNDILREIRIFFFNCHWYEVYDFLEFVLDVVELESLSEALNLILERELAAYRYVAKAFVPVTDGQEKEAIEQAIDSGPFAGVTAHLESAIEHLSRKQNPDYRNSIKESISAVESLAKELAGKPMQLWAMRYQCWRRRG